jgi:hypothetical protein
LVEMMAAALEHRWVDSWALEWAGKRAVPLASAMAVRWDSSQVDEKVVLLAA